MDDDEKTLAVYDKISNQIIKEDNIIHQRVTTGLSVNGVIATLIGVGYGITHDNLKEPKDVFVAVFVLVTLALVEFTYVTEQPSVFGLPALKLPISEAYMIATGS